MTKTNLFFTFNPEKKANKALEYADERLAEAEESASENKPEAVAVAMENYQEDISLAETEAKAIKDETKTKTLLSTIASSTSSHQKVLDKVLEKVPEKAKEAIQKAIEASKKRREAMGEVAEIKGGGESVKNNVAELKKKEEPKANQNDQSTEVKKPKKEIEPKKTNQYSEIEKLKKEIEDLKQKVEKQSNENPKLDISPVNTTPSNTIVCNGKNWTTCPMGQKFYCPIGSNGDAQCLIEDVSNQNNSGDSLLKIEKCKAEKDQSRARLETTTQGMVDALTSNYTNLLLASFKQYEGTLMASDFSGLITEYRRKQTLDVMAQYDQMVNDEYIKCINK